MGIAVFKNELGMRKKNNLSLYPGLEFLLSFESNHLHSPIAWLLWEVKGELYLLWPVWLELCKSIGIRLLLLWVDTQLVDEQITDNCLGALFTSFERSNLLYHSPAALNMQICNRGMMWQQTENTYIGKTWTVKCRHKYWPRISVSLQKIWHILELSRTCPIYDMTQFIWTFC